MLRIRPGRILTHPTSLQLVVLLIALQSILSATAAFPQVGAPQGEPGIWIADSAGNLHKVQPSSESLLRRNDAKERESLELVLAVESFAQSATGALAAGELAVTRVRRAVSATGVSAGGVTSELAYVEPRYERALLRASWEEARRLGFDAVYLVTVRDANPSQLGLLIDFVMGAGATRVMSVRPESIGRRR